MRILIVTTNLGCGGITSFLISIANTLYRDGHTVTVAYTSDQDSLKKRFVPGIVLHPFVDLNFTKRVFAAIRFGNICDLFRIKFRNHLKISPIFASQRISYAAARNTLPIEGAFDVIISSAEFFCNAYVAFQLEAPIKIGWVHPDVGKLRIDVKAAEKVVSKLNFIVAVSESGKNSLERIFPQYQSKFRYIQNISDKERILSMSAEHVDDMVLEFGQKAIITVCRLDNSSKRLDRAIHIAKILKKNDYRFRWFIVGDGKDYKMLQQLILENQLKEHVVLLGKKTNPYAYMKKADVFILTSQYEGMPIVIDEAKILNLPVIVTEYASAHEQVHDDNGIIVSNNDGKLEMEIAQILMNDTLKQQIKGNVTDGNDLEKGALLKIRALLNCEGKS